MIRTIKSFIRKQQLNGFIVKMRNELAYQYPESKTFNRKQIEECVDRTGYSKEYYPYGYCLFMTQEKGMKELKENMESAIAEITEALGSEFLWSDHGRSLMKEYSPDTSEDTGPTGTQVAAYMNHMKR